MQSSLGHRRFLFIILKLELFCNRFSREKFGASSVSSGGTVDSTTAHVDPMYRNLQKLEKKVNDGDGT